MTEDGKKLTIVKVLEKDGSVTTEDLERWRQIFAAADAETIAVIRHDTEANGEIIVQEVEPITDDENYITLVKIGDEGYKPTIADLEAWRDVFEQARTDPDYKIFTHPAIEIQIIPIGKIIAVE
jgi:hypothetical protein